jgi:hypothetical protein
MSKEVNKKTKQPKQPKVFNRGTGAGGANTNHNGLAFEELTNPEKSFEEKGFIKKIMNKNKNGYYLIKEISATDNIVYTKQAGFREYIRKHFDNIHIYRNPDEAYIIKKGDTYHIKIIEKKNQNGEGSVEEKLKTGVFNRDEYYLMFDKMKDKIVIDYAFCVSDFLQKKLESQNEKYINMKKLNDKNNIKVFYGNNPDYFDQLYQWIIQ